MKKKLSVLLILVMLFAMFPPFSITASAATTDMSQMNALDALGIDTTVSPEGYDPNSLDNPYGKNIIEVSPVYELYTVGLGTSTKYDPTYSTTSTTLQNGNNTTTHAASYVNTLQTGLYGHEAWASKTVESIIVNGKTTTAAVGTTAAIGTTESTGDYTLITSGTVASTAASFPTNGYLKDVTETSTNFGSFDYGLSAVASGNFDGNENGLAAQTAMVYTSDYSANGGLFLRFGNAIDGSFGTSAKELLGTTKNIGNPELQYEGKPVEDFVENPYQLQNYLQVATGDWNNDGYDEVAVYIPEQGNSRIVVYALQLTSADDSTTAYKQASKWSVAWTYYLRESGVVSNMVSLVSGDVNMDGTDDLAATWGYYYGPTQNIGSTAVVMFGAKGTSLLTKSQQFNLTYGSSNIVRASFDFGDMAGSDSDVLILSGQSDADLKAGNSQTRYVALYDWNGSAFVTNINQNFDLFEKDDGAYVWPQMSSHSDKYYSLPLCTANTAVISQGLGGGGDLLYFDSLIIEYTDKGLDIKEAWDNIAVMQENASTTVEYVEYGAVAGDFTGQTGAAGVATLVQTLSTRANAATSYTVTGTHWEPVYSWDYYYQNWLYKLFGIKTWFTYISGYQQVADASTVDVGYTQLSMGKAHMVVADPSADYNMRTPMDFSASICLANTDNDSSYMSYSGKHYYTYTDPEVLAVLASPPYFSDLINRDDLSGSYAESATSYSQTSGSGSGYTISSTITVGAYVSFEQDIEVFGVKVASLEAEAAITAGFTFETEQMKTLEQTVTYTATVGEDMVAFYSIPMEIYEYTSYTADGAGGYNEVLTTVNIPREAAIRLLSLEEYESIAKDYSVLPSIEGNVLTHTVGDPFSYSSATAGYDVIAEYDGTPSSVGFSSTEGGSGITQEIAMSKESNNAFSASIGVESRAGAGAGGFKVGFIAGRDIGAGYVMVSTDGSSFSGDMQNMPIEAQPYNYGMNWRIFCYKYADGASAFPVVSYVVSEVNSPPPLPDDFEQDMAATDSDSITLTWTYDKYVSGFKIYRYYEFPEGSGSYQVALVPFTKGVKVDDGSGTFQFTYKDEGLSPYTEYKYQIKTLRADNPTESIYSEPMSCRTKTETGYPTINLAALVDGKLPIYPDAESTVTVSITNPGAYSGLSYQWQKLVNGSWVSISGAIDDEFTIANAGATDSGTYRCRVNCIYYDNVAAQNYYISAYSETFATTYSKRSPTGVLAAAEDISVTSSGSTLKGLAANIELYSANTNHATAPTGNVTFAVQGTATSYSETVALDVSTTTKRLGDEEKYYSTASLSIPSLPDGVYYVTAYYSGSRVFKDMESAKSVIVVVGNGSAYNLPLSTTSGGLSTSKFEYSESIYPSLVSISKDGSGVVQLSPVADAVYKIAPIGTTTGAIFTAGGSTPYVGNYEMQAYVSGELVATQDFVVGKKPITVSVASKSNVSAGTVSENLPVISCADLTASELEALALSYTVVNSADNTIILSNTTDPGNYRVTASTSSSTPIDLYNNYSVTFVSGTYTIIGTTYRLTAIAEKYSDPSGTRPVGTVGIFNKTDAFGDYTAETAVQLYANPVAGYQVDRWKAEFANGTLKTQTGGDTFTLTTEAQTVTVTVTFKPAVIRLSTVVQPALGDKIICSDENFTSGAYVSYGAEYSFSALPVDGYHFDRWQVVSGGITKILTGTPQQDGSNNVSLTIGTASATLYAYYTRDSYTVTLSGDIKAYFMYDDDSDSTTEKIAKTIPSGGSVPGDTEVIVEPKTGFQAAVGAYFSVNGIVTSDAAIHTFPITENTLVALNTVRNIYTVTTAAINGTMAATINGASATAENLVTVEGGSKLVFTAHADRGYLFDHWKVNGVESTITTEILTIAELGANTLVEAVFVANNHYLLTAAVSTPDRGTMKYTLYNIYGDVVGTAASEMPSGGFVVYDGESVLLEVGVTSGSMMEQWEVNGVNTYTTQKTYAINNIDENVVVTAYLKAASSYMVHYIAMGETGSTLSARIDEDPFNSGTLQYGGSDLLFTAAPADGCMVDQWTITVGDLTTTEGQFAVDGEGNTITDPTYRISPLRQNLTVRVYFTTLASVVITLPGISTMGDSFITHVTPITATDDGTRDSESEAMRAGGTIRMAFNPNEGYGTSVATLKSCLEDLVNNDATISVVELAGTYYATVGNLKESFTLTEGDIYYSAYTITVPAGVSTSSTSAAAGQTVTLTVNPPSGYGLASLTLSAGSLNEVFAATRLIYTFTMPESDIAVAASFTSIPNGGGGGGGGGGALVVILPPTYEVQEDGSILVALTEEMREIPEDLNKELIDLNRTQIIIIKGNGLRIIIPAGTLRSGDDINDILHDLTRMPGGAGQVIAYIDGSGKQHLVRWSSITSGEVSFIAEAAGKYIVINNSKTFVDINGHWSQLAVNFVTARELFIGTGDNTFSTDAEMTRAMLVTVLHRLNNLGSGGIKNFPDVSNDQWYSAAVAWASTNGIVSGYVDGRFGTNDSITREQLAAILYRYSKTLDLPAGSRGSLAAFNDADQVADYAKEALEWAVGAGIISGKAGGILDPKANASRSEVATVLMKLIELRL